jgi:hypothetical protein
MSDQQDAKEKIDGDTILGLHIDLTGALEDFLAFAATAQNDLASNCEALAIVQKSDRDVKSFAQCHFRVFSPEVCGLTLFDKSLFRSS